MGGLLSGNLEVQVLLRSHTLYDLRHDVHRIRPFRPSDSLGRLGLGVFEMLGPDAEDHVLVREGFGIVPPLLGLPISSWVRAKRVLPKTTSWPPFCFSRRAMMKFIAGLPIKPATNTLSGWSYMNCGVAICWTSPSLRTTMRSAIVMASVWSWVT